MPDRELSCDPEAGLIYDVGANNGDDAAYYLARGHRVISVEANPALAGYLRLRFKEEITAGRLVVLHTAVADKDREKVVFYICSDDGRSSLIKKISERGATIKDSIELTGRTLRSLFEEFGLPRYCKIDIEGYDAKALASLEGYPGCPAYISCENSCDSIAEINLHHHLLYQALDALVSAGYSRFKLLDQQSLVVLADENHYGFLHKLSTKIASNMERLTGRVTAKYNNRLFELKKRGLKSDDVIAPFGEDLPGEWNDYKTTREYLAYHFRDYFDHLRNKQLMFWVDIHAKWMLPFLVCIFVLPAVSFAQHKKGTKGFGQESPANGSAVSPKDGVNDRAYWLAEMDKLARPVLSNLAADNLRNALPLVLSKRTDNAEDRRKSAYLEAFGRTLSGIAPWLNGEGGSAAEVALRNQYRQWVIPAIRHAVDSSAKDYMAWRAPAQALVDASFFAFSFLRCPWLWEHLDESTRRQVVQALRSTRVIQPGFNNWLLFSGMIEAFFCRYDLPWDPMRVDYCVRQLGQWYLGDGIYADGPAYHWDYYNSYVIHPYLAAIVETVNTKNGNYALLVEKLKVRDQRYAAIQERLINTDGSYPATGRSIVYRCGAFHHLADVSWRKTLPAALKPARVRCALTAVIRKTLDAPGTYSTGGWLNIGLGGNQPDLADAYITTGSLYLCSDVFLPLGLPATDPFWSDPAEPWSAQLIWNGQDAPGDHSID
ncbi:MAG: FkbM family methyltransferase [Puia sp.]|nr:FkbM family methyltransferase [Puia sp.]